jgi:hypothetical protein
LTACEKPDHPIHTADASEEVLPVLKEALVKLTLGQHPLTTWVFIANITDKSILRLDV